MESSSVENKQTTNYYDYVYDNKIKSDIDIVVKNNVIKAHKEVLGKQNPVFLDKFMSQPTRLKKIEILDFDADAVQVFIEFLYTGKISDESITEQLFLVAHKYLSSNLKNICRKKLVKSLSIENGVSRFLAFFQCEDEYLMKKTSHFLTKNYNDVKTQANFQQVLENDPAINLIFDAFDCCKVTVLSEDKNPTRKKLIESATNSDLTIKVQDHTFLGHKHLLSTRNTVFKTVFSARPKTNNLSSSINIPDFDPSTFEIFLKYIYMGNVKKDDISTELMNVAYKYTDSKLQKLCEDHLLSSVNKENAIDLLILSTTIKSNKLKYETSKFIADKYAEMKEQADFQQVKQNPEAMEAIFNQFTVIIDSLYDAKKFEGTFELKVPLESERVESESFSVKNIPWHIFASIAEDKVHLQVYLKCLDKNVPFEHEVEYSFKLISTVSKEYDLILRCNAPRIFNSKDAEPKWGFVKSITLTELKNERKGFVLNGKFKIQVNLKFCR